MVRARTVKPTSVLASPDGSSQAYCERCWLLDVLLLLAGSDPERALGTELWLRLAQSLRLCVLRGGGACSASGPEGKRADHLARPYVTIAFS